MTIIKHHFFTKDDGITLISGTAIRDDQIAQVNQTLGVKNYPLSLLKQIHSNKVISVNQAKHQHCEEADGHITDQHGIILGIITADCAPILFHDQQAGLIAATHAGWGGAFNGIAQETIAQMKKAGATNITAHIGPTIAQESYEVGPEFYKRFQTQSAENSTFFQKSAKENHYYFDLPGYITTMLQHAGITHIINEEKDTYKLIEKYHSHRRHTHEDIATPYRNLSVIALMKETTS